ARLEEARGGVENSGLLGDPAFELGGGELPLGIGTATPGARAGAGGIDQHAVETAREVVERAGIGVADLHVAHAVALEALVDGGEAGALAVIGEYLAGVAHGGGHGQRLAAGAGAEI